MHTHTTHSTTLFNSCWHWQQTNNNECECMTRVSLKEQVWPVLMQLLPPLLRQCTAFLWYPVRLHWYYKITVHLAYITRVWCEQETHNFLMNLSHLVHMARVIRYTTNHTTTMRRKKRRLCTTFLPTIFCYPVPLYIQNIQRS